LLLAIPRPTIAAHKLRLTLVIPLDTFTLRKRNIDDVPDEPVGQFTGGTFFAVTQRFFRIFAILLDGK
jgi:hypothetical protein